MSKPKHNVGDHWQSEGGLGFTITEVTDDAVVVDIDRRVRDREGRRSTEIHTRTVMLGTDFDVFSRAYKKSRKKPTE